MVAGVLLEKNRICKQISWGLEKMLVTCVCLGSILNFCRDGVGIKINITKSCTPAARRLEILQTPRIGAASKML